MFWRVDFEDIVPIVELMGENSLTAKQVVNALAA